MSNATEERELARSPTESWNIRTALNLYPSLKSADPSINLKSPLLRLMISSKEWHRLRR